MNNVQLFSKGRNRVMGNAKDNSVWMRCQERAYKRRQRTKAIMGWVGAALALFAMVCVYSVYYWIGKMPL